MGEIIPKEPLSYFDARGKLKPGVRPPLADERIAELYCHMLRARKLDERMLLLQRQGRLGTFASGLGQEAAQVGSAGAMLESDWFVPSFREAAAALTRGAPMRNVLLYAMGFEEGNEVPEGSRDLPPAVPVGSQTAHAAGLAWAAKLRGEDAAALVYFGDGATSEGITHEAMNFAGVLGLGVVFFCQNNQWAISTPLSRQTASPTIAVKALAYGFPGVLVDGNDLFAVFQETGLALARARQGIPTLIEAVTYRRGSHTTADDPRVYRTEAEEAEWAAKDPLDRVRGYLRGRGLLEEGLEREVEEEVTLAVREAEAYRDSEPDLLEMFDHACSWVQSDLARQRAEAASFLERGEEPAKPPSRGHGGAAAVGELEEAPPEGE